MAHALHQSDKIHRFGIVIIPMRIQESSRVRPPRMARRHEMTHFMQGSSHNILLWTLLIHHTEYKEGQYIYQDAWQGLGYQPRYVE